MRNLGLITAGLLLAFPMAARAAGPDEPPPRPMLDTVTQDVVGAEVSVPSGVQFSADKGEGKVTLAAGYVHAYRGSGPKAPGLFDTFSLTLSSPLEASADSGTLASLDGLGSATSLEFKFQQVRIPLPSDASRAAAYERGGALYLICEAARPAYIAKMILAEPDPKNHEEIRKAAQDQCDTDLVGGGAPDRLAEFDNLLYWGASPKAIIWGTSGKAGSETFEYVQPTLSRISTEETSWSAKVFAAYQPPGKAFDQSLFTLSYAFGETWKAKDETTICPPGGPPASCVKGPPGPPDKTNSSIASLEYRRSLKDQAFLIRVEHDFESDVTAVTIPLYLFKEKDGGFTGGLQLGWRSDTDETVAGVFVSKAFSFLEFGQ
jgi:hypothetical protein